MPLRAVRLGDDDRVIHDAPLCEDLLIARADLHRANGAEIQPPISTLNWAEMRIVKVFLVLLFRQRAAGYYLGEMTNSG